MPDWQLVAALLYKSHLLIHMYAHRFKLICRQLLISSPSCALTEQLVY